MSENNEKNKSITYIKNDKYLFNIIKVIPHSLTYIEKIGITIYKKTLEINILNKDCIDLLLKTNSNFIESYANICFLNIHGILCFFYASNKDIKEKEFLINRNNNFSYTICLINNIHCFIISYYVPPKLKQLIKEEFEKIGNFLLGDLLFFCHSPFRFDNDIPTQLEAFQNNNFKYKLFENFQYNQDFSPKEFKHFLTPIVKGYFKHIKYNNLFNEKDHLYVAIRYKIYENNKYLIEVEMFLTPITNPKYFQNIFYIYFNESPDKISFLNKIIENWNKNAKNSHIFESLEKNNLKNEGLIINVYNNLMNDENEDFKNNIFKEEISKHKNIDFLNVNISKIENLEIFFNNNIEKLKNVGYNYKYNNIDYNSQQKLLIMVINDLNLFSLGKIIAYMIYQIFLTDRGFQKIIINNAKEEIKKLFEFLDKNNQIFKSKFPERLKLQIIKEENDLKNILKFEENEDLDKNLNFNFNNKEIQIEKLNKKENKDSGIIDSFKNFDNLDKVNNNKNEQKNLYKEDLNYINNNIIENKNLKENIEEGKIIKEKNNSDNEFENININEIINSVGKDNIDGNINIDENIYGINNIKNKDNQDFNNFEYKYYKKNKDDYILGNNRIRKSFELGNNNKTITIFIGTFNVNALDCDLIKNINLDKFLFPEKIKKYFTPKNFPTFYCIGLEETIELNAKNVLIQPKNKAELWEERISEELQKKYNYFLQCKQNLVGILFLFFVKAPEIKYINNIHFEKLKSGFMGCGNKGCCFFDFMYKKNSYGFCSCHLPAGQKKKNFLERKEIFKNILNFKVNKNFNEFYKNNFFFIFGDLNFRTKKVWLSYLQNQNKVLNEDKFNKDDKINKKFRFSLELNDNNSKKFKKEKSCNLFDKKKINDKNINELINKTKKLKKDKKDYSNYLTNQGNEKSQNNMEENIFIQHYFKDFLEDEELKKMKKREFFMSLVDEPNINFPPTYKYVKGTDFYNLSKRVPSWTDRILYKKGKKIIPIYYDRICINFSDHKPIVGLFEINIDE